MYSSYTVIKAQFKMKTEVQEEEEEEMEEDKRKKNVMRRLVIMNE